MDEGAASAITDDLSSMFGIEFADEPVASAKPMEAKRTRGKSKKIKAKEVKEVKVKTVRVKKAQSVNVEATKAKTQKAKTQKAKTQKAKKAKDKSIPAQAPVFAGTAHSVRALRDFFGMSQRQFASVLGVSVASVTKWETAHGQLNLRVETRRALEKASRLTKRGAWRKIGERSS